MENNGEDIRSAIECALRAVVRHMTPLSGGMICRCARIATDERDYFVKWRTHSPDGFFAAEADGLERVRAADALRVPHVIVVQDAPNSLGFLVLEYIEGSFRQGSAGSGAALGRGLARQHLTAVSPNGMFGLERDNFLGNLPQRNGWKPTWAEFYRDRRLLPQIGTARRLRRLPEHRDKLVMEVADRVETLLSGLASQPALLHGDLWAGNFIACGTAAAICDPAVYYGEREMDISYMELFGGFGTDTFDAYAEAYPLDPGYVDRRPLHQLYHLLNHLNHFGETYGDAVDAACRRYLP